MSVDAQWYVDPLLRFSGRMFDGVQWTDQVSLDGRLRTDPDWPPTPSVVDEEPLDEEPLDEEPLDEEPLDEEPPVPVAPRGMVVPERREASDRRQINLRRDRLPERRKGARRASRLEC